MAALQVKGDDTDSAFGTISGGTSVATRSFTSGLRTNESMVNDSV